MCFSKSFVCLVWMAVGMFLSVGVTHAQSVLYVDDDAASGGDGTSWVTAFNDLQDALAASPGGEIWVAAGVYRPDGGTGDRSAWFRLVNGVAVYGGFAGNETDLSQRDPAVTVTILSGDLSGDDAEVANVPDLLTEPTRSENSYHVVTATGTDATAVLDGFTITAGNADGSGLDKFGAGMINFPGSPTVTGCNFGLGSAERQGGGMYNFSHSNPTLTNCAFSRNAAGETGGGMQNSDFSSPLLSGCTFSENWSTGGGGMYNAIGSSPTLINCSFVGNRLGLRNRGDAHPTLINCSFVHNAGGIRNELNSNPLVVNCAFIGNAAGGGMGGVHNDGGSSPTLINCLFSGNQTSHGGGVYNRQGSAPLLINCTFSDNFAWVAGGGIYNLEGSDPTLINCILWNNSDPSGTGESSQIHNDDSYGLNNPVVNYSCVQGGWSGLGGTGNIDADPLFVDSDGADNVVGTEDDDLRLASGSASIDAGDNASLPADTADLDGDTDTAEVVPVDLEGYTRVVGVAVDMGAYESQMLEVLIDIKPGSDPNCFNNNGNGVIPVAILGSSDLDVGEIDPQSVALAGLVVRVVGNGQHLQAHIEDVNEDGWDDLVVQIEDSDGVFEVGEGTATLTGALLDGTPITGNDAICIVPG